LNQGKTTAIACLYVIIGTWMWCNNSCFISFVDKPLEQSLPT